MEVREGYDAVEGGRAGGDHFPLKPGRLNGYYLDSDLLSPLALVPARRPAVLAGEDTSSANTAALGGSCLGFGLLTRAPYSGHPLLDIRIRLALEETSTKEEEDV